MPDSHIKMTVMLVVTFSSRNLRFWFVQKGKRLLLTHIKLLRIVHKD